MGVRLLTSNFHFVLHRDVPNGTHPELRSVDGSLGPTLNQSAAGSEAALDFEISMPLVYPQGVVLWAVEDEYYQANQSLQNTILKGFFNSKQAQKPSPRDYFSFPPQI